ncbi:MAG: hypothetical protein KZQ73_01955 [Candidatus Thiodiazotropha sp. (ex Semelilucina semeliformis)]|nr:hypothetical protein [Candidatus Thiodiazotropha sp. (ex Semelilucina semeliformis)]
MEDLTKARQLPPEEIAAMRERFKEAERIMDGIISERKKEEAEKNASKGER